MKTKSNHKHRAKTVRILPFTFPAKLSAGSDASHGGVTYQDTCSCGTQRRRDVNGRHETKGVWTTEEKVDE